MTAPNATYVPLPTRTYITPFVPLERIGPRDHAGFVWIGESPRRLRARDILAMLREGDSFSRSLFARARDVDLAGATRRVSPPLAQRSFAR
jgi:hypothetical protein